MEAVCKAVYHLSHTSDGLMFVKKDGKGDQVYFVSEGTCTCNGFKHRGKCRHLQMSWGTFEGDFLTYAEFFAVNEFLKKDIMTSIVLKPGDGYDRARSITIHNMGDFEEEGVEEKILELKIGSKKFVLRLRKKGEFDAD